MKQIKIKGEDNMLNAVYKLELKINLLTGLHIGGSSDSFDIGGADSTVIKNPMTNEPYIPGSSLKGKMHALLGYKYGIDKQLVIIDSDIAKLFTPNSKANNDEIKITRAIFRDLYLCSESVEKLEKQLGYGIYTEIKGENYIDKLKGIANPRFIERVPAGVSFNGEIVLMVFDGDNEEKMQNGIKEGLKLIELNYLGGSGTRGYGRVSFEYGDFKKVEI